MKRKVLVFLGFILLVFSYQAQEETAKFGKVSEEELYKKSCDYDQEAFAEVLFRNSSSVYEINDELQWVIRTKVHERIKIYGKNGFKWATKRIAIYKDLSEEEKLVVRGFTHRFIDGKPKRIKLKSKNVFSKVKNEHWKEYVFTMPMLEVGCIVEWEYTIVSPFTWNVPEVKFQYKIPARYIYGQVRIPDDYKFRFIQNGSDDLKVSEESEVRMISYMNGNSRIDLTEVNAKGKSSPKSSRVKLNEQVVYGEISHVPALKNEPFVSNINNYMTKLSFEIVSYTPANAAPRFFSQSWEDVSSTIHEWRNFGVQLKKTKYFKDDLLSITKDCENDEEKLNKIFDHVKSLMTWDRFHAIITETGVVKSYEEGEGNVAEINLILTAMLREAGLQSNPILVSTRNNGIAMFPTIEGFNYVLCGVMMDGKLILLDATEKNIAPGLLPVRAINWYGRLIRSDGSSEFVELTQVNKSTEFVFGNLKFDENKDISGVVQVILENTKAFDFRNEYASKSLIDIALGVEDDCHNGFDLSNMNVEGLNNPLERIVLSYDVNTDFSIDVKDGELYFLPLSAYGDFENPFVNEERELPIDFIMPSQEKILFNYVIPEGYVVASLPESILISLPDDICSYKFICKEINGHIQVLSQFEIKTTVLPKEYYDSVKDFFGQIVNKQSEKIVLIKS